MPELLVDIPNLGSLSFLILMSAARSLGFLAGFTLIGFAVKRGAMLRFAFAFALGLPVGIANLNELYAVYAADSLVDRAFLPVKEMLVGFLMAKIASLPFYAFLYAGAICDGFRGESSNSLSLEGADTVTTGALVFYFVIAFSFLTTDGLWRIFEILYASYLLWPIGEFLPELSGKAILVLVDLIRSTFALMIRVGFPLLFILFIAEISLMVASRIGRRYALQNYSFVIKNMIFLISLPLYLTFISRVALTEQDRILMPQFFLKLLFQ